MREWRIRLSIAVLIAIFFSILPLSGKLGRGDLASPASEEFVTDREDARAASMNETLGFGEILAISLSYRTDRRDYLTLLSDFGRLKFTLLHGVTGEETAKSPVIPKNTGLRPAELGCWRSHVNAWQRIVESRIATALILEDDADWHVDIKGQMALLSKALLSGKNPFPKEFKRFEVGNTTRLADPSFPYGRDWDLLMLGQCWTAFDNPNPIRPGFTYVDTAGPAKAEQPKFVREAFGLYRMGWDDRKDVRIISQAYGPICTTAYALTNRGAHKLLYNIGYLGPKMPVDMSFMRLGQDEKIAALTIHPPLFSQWRVNGSQDSDTKDKNTDDTPGDSSKGESWIGELSARKVVKKNWSFHGK